MKQLQISCSIQVHNEYPIVLYKHCGIIEKNSIIEAWRKVLLLLIHKEIGYDLILDFREAHFVFKPFEIDDIVNFFYSGISVLNGRRIAGIANASHEAAIIKLIETLTCKDLDYQVRLFCTFEEAFKYMNPI